MFPFYFFLLFIFLFLFFAVANSHRERQYKYRFPRLKNISEEEYAEIDDECRRRAALGKQTTVRLHGHPLPPERLQRGISRVKKNRQTSRTRGRRTSRDAGRISFRTPSPAPPPTRFSSPLSFSLPFPPPVSLPPGNPDLQFASQRLIGLGDVDMETPADLGVGMPLGKYLSTKLQYGTLSTVN